ncbi:MAG: hypothetical protein KDA58_01905 [Planctomycetaceae bacterium]|nr:hypothetical protein [Planctomycetaceae bacterium]
MNPAGVFGLKAYEAGQSQTGLELWPFNPHYHGKQWGLVGSVCRLGERSPPATGLGRHGIRTDARTWLAMAVGIPLLGLAVQTVDADAPMSDRQRLIQRLVMELGSDDFRERTAAERTLMSYELDALDAVRAAAESPDAEVRYRARRLLDQLQSIAARQHEQALLDAPWQAGEDLYPIWERWQELVGDSPSSRKLLVAMLRKEPELLLAMTRPPNVWRNRFETRCGQLRVFGIQSRQETNTVTAAALLFAALLPETQPSSQAANVVSSSLVSGQFQQMLSHPDVGPASQSLMDHWLVHEGLSTPQMRFQTAVNMGSPLGVVAARQLLLDGRNYRQQSHQAVMYIARYLGEDGIELLESKLDDRSQLFARIVGNSRSTREITNVVTLSDVALLALLQITSQSPADYGYKDLIPDPANLYKLDSCGLADEEARVAAAERWHQWRATHLQQEQAEPVDASEGELL